jgi:hypothetical protein
MDVSYKGTVRNGVVVLPPEVKLAEGTAVEVIPEEASVGDRLAKTASSQSNERQRALDSLYALFCEGRAPGWDGYGARPALYESYVEARRFVQALPAEFNVPEFALDPDGEISLEWHAGLDRTFSVSFGASGELSYAGKFNSTTKTHGTEQFTGEIPIVILGNLRRLAT